MPTAARSIWFKRDRKALTFAIMRNDTLGIALGGTTGTRIPYPPVLLIDDAGQPNRHNVAAFAAVTGTISNIADVYDEPGFDFQRHARLPMRARAIARSHS